MIKFIATDLDGTLLDGQKNLPSEIFPLIERLYAQNVLFAPASGRQYPNLKDLFAPVQDKVIFICENGAIVNYRGQTVFLDPIPPESILTALNAIRAIPHAYPMLCGVNCSYIESSKQPFYTYATQAYTSCRLVENLNDLVGKEEICKIAVYDELGSAENCYRYLPELLPSLRVILSGADWCDVSNPTATKGAAIQMIQKKFSLKKEECLAFGDHMNDYEMLLECGQAFVPENAYPPLKALIKNTVPANTEGGVITKIKEILQEVER